jgi:hypothetical protein
VIDDVGILYGHLVYSTAIWYIVWPFGIFHGHLVYFFPALVSCIKENLATLDVIAPLSLMYVCGYLIGKKHFVISLFCFCRQSHTSQLATDRASSVRLTFK